MKKLLLFALLTLLILPACEKRNLVWLDYPQTQCADPWGEHESDQQLFLAIENFFFDLGVTIRDIKIEKVGSAQDCLACACLTGNAIRAQVHKDEQDVLLQYGFVKE